MRAKKYNSLDLSKWLCISQTRTVSFLFRGKGIRFWWTKIPVKAKTCKIVRFLSVCWPLVWPLNQLKSSKGSINTWSKVTLSLLLTNTSPRQSRSNSPVHHLHYSPSHPIPALNSRELSWAAVAAGLSDPGQSYAFPTTCPCSSLRNSDTGKSL